MLEATLVIIIVSLGILTIALGLQTAVTADNNANEQQRLNLAVTTFGESLKQSPWTWWTCPAVSSPPPNSQTLSANAAGDSSHAHAILRRALANAPEAQAWADRGVTFTVTDVKYWDPSVGDLNNDDAFVGDCSDDRYSYAAAKVSFEACWDRDLADSQYCTSPNRVLAGEVVKRSNRFEE